MSRTQNSKTARPRKGERKANGPPMKAIKTVEDYMTLKIQRFNPFPLPTRFRTTLPYYEQVNFAAVTTPQVYVFRGNSPYDPNQTGTGAQPVGWDNLITFYESSLCVGSRIEVTVINNTAVPLQFSVCPTTQSSTLSTYEQSMFYNRYVRSGYADGTGRGSSSVKKLIHEMNVFKFLEQPYDRDFEATGQAVAGKQFYWTIAFQTTDTVSPINCSLQFRVYYDVIFHDPKLVALS